MSIKVQELICLVLIQVDHMAVFLKLTLFFYTFSSLIFAKDLTQFEMWKLLLT